MSLIYVNLTQAERKVGQKLQQIRHDGQSSFIPNLEGVFSYHIRNVIARLFIRASAAHTAAQTISAPHCRSWQ